MFTFINNAIIFNITICKNSKKKLAPEQKKKNKTKKHLYVTGNS